MGIINDLKALTGNKNNSLSKEKTPAKKLLIVEDEKALADILDERFTREGFTVYKAQDGQKGLELVAAHHPDVVLLDLMMPVMDGKSMLIKLREMPEFKNLPVLVLTNAGEIENVRVTQRYLNAVEFLIKANVSMDTIVEKVKTFVP